MPHVLTPETPKGKAAAKCTEVLEETDDRIKADVCPHFQLYGDENELQAIQDGSVEVLAPSSARSTTIAPPLGRNLLVASGMTVMSVLRIAEAALPSALVLPFALSVVTCVPDLALAFPETADTKGG